MARTQISKSDKIKRRKRRRRQLIGLVFTVLVVIGIASIVSVLTGYATRLFDNSGEKEDFEALIAPLVSIDDTFSSLENANPNTLMAGALWGALNNNDLSIFTRNEDGLIMLPDTEVALYAAKMYGPNYAIVHRTFTSVNVEYEYDANQKVYIIPPTSQSGSYTPVIEKITTSGQTKILLVAYMQQSGSSADMILDPTKMIVVKYREYVMIKTSGEYYLYAIRVPETMPETTA